MPLTYTAEQMIATVRNRARIPNTDDDGTKDADILRWLDEQMKLDVVPWLLATLEDYFVLTESLALSSNRVRIPTRAIGNKLRELKYRKSGGTAADDVDLSYVSRENLNRFNLQWSGDSPYGFYIENVDIVIVPEDFTGGGNLIASYFFRPGDLVKTDEYATVSSIASNVVTVDAAPSGFTTALTYDVHSPDSGAEVKAWDLACSDVTSNDFTFTLADIDGSATGKKAVAVGDYLVQANNAAIPALPREMHPLLCQSAAVAILFAQGFDEEAERQDKILQRMFARSSQMLKSRVEGEPPAVVVTDGVWFDEIGYYGAFTG